MGPAAARWVRLRAKKPTQNGLELLVRRLKLETIATTTA
jgi:hypothetical protein